MLFEIIPNRKVAKVLRQLQLLFLFLYLLIIGYVLPGVGSITTNGTPLFRGLPAVLKLTLALAIVTVISVQVYGKTARAYGECF